MSAGQLMCSRAAGLILPASSHISPQNALLDDMYETWVTDVAASLGKTREEVRRQLQHGTSHTALWPGCGAIRPSLVPDQLACLHLARLEGLSCHPAIPCQPLTPPTQTLPHPPPPPLQVEALLDEGVYDMRVYKERGFVTDLVYECELEELLKKRTETEEGKELRKVGGGGGGGVVGLVRCKGLVGGRLRMRAWAAQVCCMPPRPDLGSPLPNHPITLHLRWATRSTAACRPLRLACRAGARPLPWCAPRAPSPARPAAARAAASQAQRSLGSCGR